MPFVCHELHPTLFDIPMRWKPQRELMVRALRVAFADFSAAPWQGLEKPERCPNNSSLFRPQAAVIVVVVQVLTGPQNGIRHPLTFLCAGTRRLSKAPRGFTCVASRRRLVQVLAGPQSGIRHFLTFLDAGTRALNNSPLGCCLPRPWRCRAVQVLTGNKKEHPDGCSFLLWASQDLNPGPSGYENVANFEIPFFL